MGAYVGWESCNEGRDIPLRSDDSNRRPVQLTKDTHPRRYGDRAGSAVEKVSKIGLKSYPQVKVEKEYAQKPASIACVRNWVA